MYIIASVVALLACPSVASPVGLQGPAAPTVLSREPKHADSSSTYNWSEGWQTSYPIHESCNSTLRAQLEVALGETVQLAQHAKEHILRFGNNSDIFRKYFGNSSTATPIGWYDRVVAADKSQMTFRCDDPDRQCELQDSWAGHWRGENATSETVICPLSFEIRRPLSAVCNGGYTVANSKLNTYWAVDLLHRVLHVPDISEGTVDHFAEDYVDALRLAKESPENSVYDSDVIQYFAIEAWAYDIAAPGVGCVGKVTDDSDQEKPTQTLTGAPAATKSVPTECHTHDDGAVHCV